MKENTHKKSLAKFDNNLFHKIKKAIGSLLKSNKKESMVNQNNIEEQSNAKIENSFINYIKVPEKKTNLKLQEIKKDLEEGKIIEEDLCEQEIKELKTIYLQQIEEKKQSIENYKKRIVKIKAQLS